MYYYNTAGRRFVLQERPLEPPDCFAEEELEYDEEEYDRVEDEANGKFDRFRHQGRN